MRINRYIAQRTGLSRRAADSAIDAGRVKLNQAVALPGHDVKATDHVYLDNKLIEPVQKTVTVMLNKPVGYVCSRNGQGSPTIYDLLPEEYQLLQSIGRLDKDSSGLLLLTNDGNLANELTHPRYAKQKVYIIDLNKNLSPSDRQKVELGVAVEDYISRLSLKPLPDNRWQVTMTEGRNRQIRRTFAALGYSVIDLHRVQFGEYKLSNLASGDFQKI